MSLRDSLDFFRHTVFSSRAALLGACALMGACATTPVPTGSRLVVTAASAQFYKNGPAQEMSFSNDPQTASLRTLTRDDYGADGQLSKGAQVTMLKREIGFSRVMTENGAIGYIANDQMKPAPSIARNFSAPDRVSPKYDNVSQRPKPQKLQPPEEKLDLLDLPLPLPG